MKAETQHLDFLISQYVDGTLEGAGKKSVEQKMLTDPEARKLYAEHREVQDILDDYGNRIPLVNWDEFDKTLDERLEVEAREKMRGSIFRRRLKPVAAAAALLIAVGLGYGWKAMSNHTVQQMPGSVAATQMVVPPSHNVVFPESLAVTRASQVAAKVDEPGTNVAEGSVEGITYSAPADQVAFQALEMSVQYGFGNLLGSVGPQTAPVRGTVVGSSGATVPADEPDPF